MIYSSVSPPFKLFEVVRTRMYRAILPDTEIDCERYEETENGVELFDGDGEMLAFVPYTSLVALINDDVDIADERSIM